MEQEELQLDELFEYAARLFNDREIPYDIYHQYYDGDHVLSFATAKFRSSFGRSFSAFALNLCPVVVDTLADRMRLEKFDVIANPELDIEPDTETVLKEIDRLWTFNRMDRRQHEVHHEAFRCGDAYTIVWPDPLTGIPVIWPQDPSQIIVGVNTDNPNILNWAMKIWRTADEYVRVTIYTIEGIFKYQSTNRNRTGRISVRLGDYAQVSIEGEPWPVPNPYLQVPVFPFRNNVGSELQGRSELRDLIPVQDAINKTLMDMIVGQEYFALPQRYATGIEPSYDSDGNEIQPFDSATGKLWMAVTDNAAFGQFPASDVTMLQKNADGLIEKFAVMARIPLHYLTPMSGDRWPSGEALKTAEASLVSKLLDRQTIFGNPWEDTFQLALKQLGLEGIHLSSKWADPNPRAETEKYDRFALLVKSGVDAHTAAIVVGMPQEIIDALAAKEVEAAELMAAQAEVEPVVEEQESAQA